MSDDELRPQVERAVWSLDETDRLLGTMPVLSGVFGPLEVLAEAGRRWLIANPADDAEPVTEADMQRLGIQPNDLAECYTGYFTSPSVGGGRLYVLFNRVRPAVEVICESTLLVTDPTVGQFRRLCAALGIPLGAAGSPAGG
jgi:hypothetical protein